MKVATLLLAVPLLAFAPAAGACQLVCTFAGSYDPTPSGGAPPTAAIGDIICGGFQTGFKAARNQHIAMNLQNLMVPDGFKFYTVGGGWVFTRATTGIPGDPSYRTLVGDGGSGGIQPVLCCNM